MKATCPRIGRVLLMGVSFFASLILSRDASAGNGMINFTSNTIDITVNCRFAATAPQLTTLEGKLTAMSHLLWDATEGQLRLGNVTITCNEATLDAADYWVYVNPFRSFSNIGPNVGVTGQSNGTLGSHTKQFYDETGGVFAHEFGHNGFGLRDEYAENQTICGGQGLCIDTPTEQNQCLMQQSSGLTWSEFCVRRITMEPREQPPLHVKPAYADGAPCAVKCEDGTSRRSSTSDPAAALPPQVVLRMADVHIPALAAPGVLRRSPSGRFHRAAFPSTAPPTPPSSSS